MKQRYLLCLLLSGLLLYYGLPNLDFHSGGMEGIFTLAWAVFALFVILGNLSALLYSPKKNKSWVNAKTNKEDKRKMRAH
ncbi:hypothetical protein [Falsibacillus pallidus]|uniref:Uncharacterized protein n=1 Tax=Falsibacillus pallidus TaxID=493781 RepID=A0A370GQM5_9BACI|nr:hypothetical protein [Falsibacillus pallidus]RDI44263.1 hypothetical protein DFR59_103334 [Falsibacillus pallidus]